IRRHPVDPTKWQVRYVDPTGRERSKTFKRKTDAESFLIHVEAQKQRGEWVDPDRAATRLQDWAERWLATRTHLKPKTITGYESLLRTHIVPRFGTMRLDCIEALSIEAWMADLQAAGLSSSRIRQAHQLLGALLKAAVHSRYLVRNPSEGTKPPRAKPREKLFLEPHQIDALADAVADHYRTLIYLLGYGGLRWGEAVALRRHRIDMLRGRIEISESLAEVGGKLIFGPTKNHRTRSIVVPIFLRDMLHQHSLQYAKPAADALVITTISGAPVRNSNFSRRVWKPGLRAGGLPPGLRIHDLRHTAAALLISRGAHPEAIKRHLGHSSIMVTMDTYGHLFPSETEALAHALDALYIDSQTDNRRTKHGQGRSAEYGSQQ
ncbi:MAG: tyrosine-type recombinase/integrase, partial [Acidimicrobiia bacterium]